MTPEEIEQFEDIKSDVESLAYDIATLGDYLTFACSCESLDKLHANLVDAISEVRGILEKIQKNYDETKKLMAGSS